MCFYWGSLGLEHEQSSTEEITSLEKKKSQQM